MNDNIVIINENLRGFPTDDAVAWHELKEVEHAINNAKGGFKGDFASVVARLIQLRKKLGLPIGI